MDVSKLSRKELERLCEGKDNAELMLTCFEDAKDYPPEEFRGTVCHYWSAYQLQHFKDDRSLMEQEYNKHYANCEEFLDGIEKYVEEHAG